jgi:Transposase DDE domain group 1
MASDRMSCHSATANQVRLILHTAAFWLMLSVRDAIPQTHPLAKAEFNTLRECLIKIGARVIEHLARVRVQLPQAARRASCSAPSRLASRHPGSGGGIRPDEQGRSTRTRCTLSCRTPILIN